jgi:hypothetical protein
MPQQPSHCSSVNACAVLTHWVCAHAGSSLLTADKLKTVVSRQSYTMPGSKEVLALGRELQAEEQAAGLLGGCSSSSPQVDFRQGRGRSCSCRHRRWQRRCGQRQQQRCGEWRRGPPGRRVWESSNCPAAASWWQNTQHETGWCSSSSCCCCKGAHRQRAGEDAEEEALAVAGYYSSRSLYCSISSCSAQLGNSCCRPRHAAAAALLARGWHVAGLTGTLLARSQ